MGIKNRIENNIIITIIGFTIGGFMAGFSTHEYIIYHSNRYFSEELVEKKYVKKEAFSKLENEMKTLQSKCERLDTLKYIDRKEYLALQIELMNIKNKFENKPKVMQNEQTVKSNLVKWSEALNSKNYGNLLSLYSNEVDYYQTLRTRNQCVESKMRHLFNTNYNQKIMENIKIRKEGFDIYVVDFTKEVKVDGKTNSYESQLKWKNGMIVKEI